MSTGLAIAECERRWKRSPPWMTPPGAGATLVAGSDWPVSTPCPLEAIHVAVNSWAHDRAPGQVADLVVLDRDPFVADSGEIGATQVVSTWDGVAVHRA